MGLRNLPRARREETKKFDDALSEKMPDILKKLPEDVSKKVTDDVYELTKWAVGKVDTMVILRRKYQYLVKNWHLDRFPEDTDPQYKEVIPTTNTTRNDGANDDTHRQNGETVFSTNGIWDDGTGMVV